MLLKSNSSISIITRQLAFQIPKQLPVIKVPKYIEHNVPKAVHDAEVNATKVRNDGKIRIKFKGDRKRLVISSQDSQLNHYFGQTYRKSSQLPLITKDWPKDKSIGQKMTFHVHDRNPAHIESPDNAFSSIGLNGAVCQAIESLNITKPTSIQLHAIPAILSHKNLLCSAETGSGKTVAYLAPIMQMIREYKELKGEQTCRKNGPKGIIIVPSRELAEQVGRVAQKLSAHIGIGVAVMFGGAPKHITSTGMDLIVTTIGLVPSMLSKKIYSLKNLNHLVIDEADTLLDDSFNFEVLDILQNISINDSEELNAVQTIFISATLPQNVEESLDNYIDLNSFDKITTYGLHQIMPHVTHKFYRIDRRDRDAKLLELVHKDYVSGRPAIIFSNRSKMANWVYHYLNANNIPCLRLNKSVDDEERINVFNRFQEGECDFISCTDLGSRGLDTTRVEHVINFECPHFTSDYIHRSGRTGRLGSAKQSLVTSLVCFKPDSYMVQKLELALRQNKEIEEVNGNIKKEMEHHQDMKLRRKRGNLTL